MTDVVFSLDVFGAVAMLSIIALFLISVITLFVVLIRKLHIALQTIAFLRKEVLTLFSAHTQSLQKHNENLGNAYKEIIKSVTKQMNITIENYR